MDSIELNRLKKLHPDVLKDQELKWCLKGIGEYLNTGEPFSVKFGGDMASYDKIVKLLGIEDVKGKDILALNVTNWMTDWTKSWDRVDRDLFSGEQPLKMLIESVADLQPVMASDYVNDFYATVVVGLDEKTVVAIGHKSEEISVSCDDCRDYGDEHFDEVGCGHVVEDGYIREFWLAVYNKDEIRNRPGWTRWNLDYVDVDAEKAEAEMLQIERENREGIINLARLACGDVLDIAMEDGMGIRFKIMRPGERPLGYMSGVRPDGEAIKSKRTHIDGSGTWTTRKQNPVQSQDKGLTPHWGMIPRLGGVKLLFRTPDGSSEDHYVTDSNIKGIELMRKH